ncbi:hypothetical protein M1L60_17940 [Actinoplanes sp. TRM 88003]|uniref:Uncharacterized protein n=1 Tax=Paractinoplanes aksuensis TaxID=2939490 RepID=A0ABT1DNQ4_9ACTN|nr:hypothetical protein [Actinoplanes aksuensis]MCO8272479.1 hypothetical protein [Actinoplanes aksuensis]
MSGRGGASGFGVLQFGDPRRLDQGRLVVGSGTGRHTPARADSFSSPIPRTGARVVTAAALFEKPSPTRLGPA